MQHPIDQQHPGGWLRKHSRLREAWWVLTGKHSLHMAWQAGLHEGTRSEYQRVVVNGGDLMPLIDATIYATTSEILHGAEPQADILRQLRRKAWQRHQSERHILSKLPIIQSNCDSAPKDRT